MHLLLLESMKKRAVIRVLSSFRDRSLLEREDEFETDIWFYKFSKIQMSGRS